MDNVNTCCPAYTIRLDVTKFRPSKKHSVTLKLFSRYLSGKSADEEDEKAKEEDRSSSCASDIRDGHVYNKKQASANMAMLAHKTTEPIDDTAQMLQQLVIQAVTELTEEEGAKLPKISLAYALQNSLFKLELSALFSLSLFRCIRMDVKGGDGEEGREGGERRDQWRKRWADGCAYGWLDR
jgi:hypothetical protein